MRNQPSPLLLTINDVSMHFSGLIALKNVNFTVTANSITALIGPNGAGKTTLFNCLTGFYQPTQGEILFHQPEKTLALHKLKGSHLIARAGIARTFQNIRLFRNMTVIENLLVAQHPRPYLSGLFRSAKYRQRENEMLNRAYEWLDKFKMAADANRLAGTLPYGKQRHLEIARAMCTQPKLLCLDEPAAGLNPKESQALCELILSLRDENQVTILLIEHDMTLVMNISDEVVVLDHGEVISTGSPNQINEDQRVIDAYLGVEHAP